MGSTTLYLVRHGEAEDEQESTDPGLSALGRRQALAIGARLSRMAFSSLMHSSRRRAIQTAHIVAELVPNVDPVQSEYAEDLTPVPTDFSGIDVEYHDFLRSVPESERDVDGRRLQRAMSELGHVGDADRTTLVITHNFVIGWFVRHALDAPDGRWIGLNQANCALTIIRYDSRRAPRLVTFNDTGHLELLSPK